MKIRALLLVFPGVLLLTGCTEFQGDGDIVTSEYASYKEASSKGILEAGWLPQALPRSATSIMETHNVDSNALWVTFRYVGNDVRGLTKECVSNGKVLFPNSKQIKRSTPWWPKELTEVGDDQSRKQFAIFLCPNARHAESTFLAYVAIDERHRKAWYWLAK